MKVYYDSSLTGSGKTHSAIDYYVKSERKVLAVVPSIDLAREYEKKAYELAKDKCNSFFCKVITSEDKKTGKGKGKPVKQMVQDAIDGANKKEVPVFLVITHITFKGLMLDGMRGIDGWCLLIDECIDLFSTASMSLTKLSATNFHDKFYWKKSCFSGLMTVGVKEEYKNVLISLLNGEVKDDGWWGREDALQFLEYVLSSSFSTYLVEDDFFALQRVMKGHDEGVKLYFLSAVDKASLSQFSSISILSAMFEKTVLCEVLRSTGMQCKFYNFSGSSSSSHDNGDRLKIHYFIDKNNSISFMNKGGEKGDDNESKVVRTALSIIGDEDFIFNANVDSRKKKAYKT
ncbi:hypothetical protein P1P91_09320 [Halomonas piscis]|uniref:Helicase/UvrB N-terminal domain-containing protein n=1 Tax=Halomonas piscis TaxID=3031727 RepID=A0ABY9YW41_9GAMM|nr:hypothetical protein [Halomonas piscis]WNK19080.1 hypothetical protein P1P91_09320 [Halomonas piscis]